MAVGRPLAEELLVTLPASITELVDGVAVVLGARTIDVITGTTVAVSLPVGMIDCGAVLILLDVTELSATETDVELEEIDVDSELYAVAEAVEAYELAEAEAVKVDELPFPDEEVKGLRVALAPVDTGRLVEMVEAEAVDSDAADTDALLVV